MADVEQQTTETPVAKIVDENEAEPKVASDDVVEAVTEAVAPEVVKEAAENGTEEVAVVDDATDEATPVVENGDAVAPVVEDETETDGAKRKSDDVVTDEPVSEKKAKLDEEVTAVETKEVVEANGEPEAEVVA